MILSGTENYSVLYGKSTIAEGTRSTSVQDSNHNLSFFDNFFSKSFGDNK